MRSNNSIAEGNVSLRNQTRTSLPAWPIRGAQRARGFCLDFLEGSSCFRLILEIWEVDCLNIIVLRQTMEV